MTQLHRQVVFAAHALICMTLQGWFCLVTDRGRVYVEVARRLLVTSVIDSSEIPRFWLRLKFQCATVVSAQTRAPAPDILMRTQMGNKFYFKSRDIHRHNLEILENVPDAFEKKTEH